MSVDDELLFYGISTYNGQSGASLLVQAKNGGWYTAGIHVAGAAALKANFASRLTKEKVSWIVGALQSAGGR